MNLWKMTVPDFVYNGNGSIQYLKDSIPLEARNIFVVIDKNVKNTNFGNKINCLLEDYNVFYWDNFNSDPTIEEVLEGSKYYVHNIPDCMIAVGGGSAIDAAKAIALLGENPSYNIDNCYKNNNKEETFPYFIAVPTTCGTGAESSPYAIIKDNSIHKKNAMERDFFVPKTVILDSDSLASLSTKYRAATALDTFVHMIEVHTATTSTELVRISTRGSLLSFGQNFHKAIFNGDRTSLEILHYIAFTTRLLYPRTGLSIAHSIAHILGAHTGLHHGMMVSIIMPEVIRYNQDSCPELFDEASNLINNNKLDLALWIEDILYKTGIYAAAKPYFKDVELDLNHICSQTLKSSNIISNPKKIQDTDDLKKLLTKILSKIN